LSATFAAGKYVTVDLLGVVAGHERSPTRPATTGVIELRESESSFGERIEVGSFNFSAVAPQIRVAKIIGEDEDDVRFTCVRYGDQENRYKNGKGSQSGLHRLL
jgi:hypothetical protein